MKSSSLTVLVPTHGRPKLLKRTLNSLAQCALLALYHELVVIENGSRAGAEQVVGELPERLNARYMHREQGNKSFALNEALETIEDGMVVFFDDDVRVASDILIQYARAAGKNGRQGFFGGPTDVDYEAPPPDWLKPYLPGSARGWGLKGLEVESHPWFLGSNWAAFAKDLKQLGGFDTSIGVGSAINAVGEETDMQKRLVAIGAEQVFVPGAKVWHYVPEERCSKQWVIRRYYRLGTTHGLQKMLNDEYKIFPWWTIKEWARYAAVAAKQAAFRNSREAFGAAVKANRIRGILMGALKGYHMKKNNEA